MDFLCFFTKKQWHFLLWNAVSYSGIKTTNKVKEIIGLVEDVKNRDVIIVEDIIDTGITMETIISELNQKAPASVKIATLLFKPDAFIKNFKILIFLYTNRRRKTQKS